MVLGFIQSKNKCLMFKNLTPYIITLQDLPPKGGYAPINYKRVPARTLVNGKWKDDHVLHSI